MSTPPDPQPSESVPDPDALFSKVLEEVTLEERSFLHSETHRYQARIEKLEEDRTRMLLLLDLAGGLHRVGRVEDLFDEVLSSALKIANADRAYLLQNNADGTVRVVVSRGRDGIPAPADDLKQLSQTILERVLEQNKTLYISDALTNPEFMALQSVQDLSLRTVIAVPLPGPSGVVGALYVDSRRAEGILETEQVQLLEAFSAQAALALEAAAHREALEERAEGLARANQGLQEALGKRSGFDRILGRSSAMERVFKVLERVVGNSVTVLIQGETGTGKELVAEALHFNGPRKEGNFIPVNCGAIPENLLESELFGYRKGAFTGADSDRMGLVEAANGGTLFLDEIGELPPPLQVKLLRVLQESEVRRLGENTGRRVNVRYIAATNRNLLDEVKGGRFREDLYYRINVVTVELPALRERGDDIPLLADTFLERVREESGRPELRLGREARRILVSYGWPGNVRELMNAVERAGALALSDEIEPQDLLPRLATSPPLVRQGTLKETLRRAEEAAIRDALRESIGNVSQASRLLGVSRQHLHARLRLLAIERPY